MCEEKRRKIADLEQQLINDGWYKVAIKMSDLEILEASTIDDYNEYTEYMQYMSRKYNV